MSSSALYVYPREKHTGETGKNICALGSCLFTTTTKGRWNRGGGGGGGARAMPGYIPTDFGRYATPYFNLAGPPHYYSPTPSDFQNLPTALPLGVKARVMPIMEFGYKNLIRFQF